MCLIPPGGAERGGEDGRMNGNTLFTEEPADICFRSAHFIVTVKRPGVVSSRSLIRWI